MKAITIILIGLLSTSCLTVDRISRNCDKFASVCITETETETETTTETETETTYGDTTATIHISEEKAKDKIPVKVEDENKKPIMVIDDKKGQAPIKKKYVNSELSVLTVPYARSTAQVVNSRLEHELTQTDTVLLFKLKNALRSVKTLEKQNKVLKEKYVVTVKENTAFAKACIKIVWALVVIVILGIGYLAFKYKTRILRLFK